MARSNGNTLMGPSLLRAALAARRAQISGDVRLTRIPADMTFRQWCESLAGDRIDPATGRALKGLRVDGHPFRHVGGDDATSGRLVRE